MARVMISDPHSTVTELLVRMVAQLGYEPVAVDVDSPPTPARLRSADVLLVEPTTPAARRLARTACAANPSVAILSQGAPEGLERLGLTPAAHLAKPFTVEQLDVALRHALAHPSNER
jgi:CheY-like chemotaxis protein